MRFIIDKAYSKLIYLALLIPLLFISYGNADDTEIYLSPTVDVFDDAVRPNIMFLMDTSGSMNDHIAVEVPAEGDSAFYNANTDYGSSDENLIYVYNNDFEFQNITHTYEQSVCREMEDFFVENRGFPVFLDRAMQWQSSTTTQTIEETELVCEEIEVDNAEFFVEEDGRVDTNEWDYYGPYDVGAGTEFVVTGRTDGNNDRIQLYIRLGAFPTTSRFDCRRFEIREPRETCSVTVGNSDTQAFIGVRGRRNNSDYDLEITFGGSGTVEQCENITTPTDVTVTEANWSEVLETSDDNEWVLECFSDRNRHGINNSSNLNYVENCGSNDCTEPEYSSSSSNEINWNGVETRTFVTANYHDFIQAFGAPEEGVGNLPVGNVGSFCNDQDNEGTQFRDDDGVVYQCTRKLDLMISSVRQLLASLTNVNIGLARLNGDHGAYILEAIRGIDESDVLRDQYIQTVENLPASGNTPLTESLFEMMRYFQGETPEFGLTNSVQPDPDALDGSRYDSPILNSCQSNNVILLTDGEPTADTEINSVVTQLSQISCPISGSSSTSAAGSCLDEIAGYAATNDISTGPDGINGTQVLRTYTIGFDIDLPLLDTTAQQGGGRYFTAGDSFELTSAFNSIVVDILADASTFVAPAISVNAFNQLQSRNELYFAVFRPDNSPRWTGNVKKYTISTDGTILDANGQPAVDPSTGFFSDISQDLWSTTIDGGNVDAGGFRDQLPDNRRIFTFFGDNPNEVNLTTGGGIHQFNTSNSLITRQILGLDATVTEQVRNQLILWGAGEDLFDNDGDGRTDDANNFVSDPLHSRPFLVTYGGTEENPHDVVFVGSNIGFLHAIDGASGEELWSFIPDDLIRNIRPYQEGDVEESRVYGLDGEISLWVSESLEDSDQDIEVADGDFVYLYTGMRRGGRDYYAIDATNYDPNNLSEIYPILKWKINGGEGEFEDLGQSWSRMIHATVNWNCNQGNCIERDVLFFTGGYDTVHDTADAPTQGDLGNALFMVDADTGELIWSAGNNSDNRVQRTHDLSLDDLQNSIPGSPNVVDVDADGIADVVFIVDIVGNVFRFDLNDETETASDFATAGQIFELNQGNDFRRFYNQPDIVLSGERGSEAYFNLVFGSGYMAHPRDVGQQDSIFVLFEENVFTPPTNENGDIIYDLIREDQLFDTRAGGVQPANRLINAPHGYHIPFTGNGEKMLRPGLIFQDTITYTSYLPEGNINRDACSGGSIGGSRLYRVDLATGLSLLTLEDSNDPLQVDAPEFIELARPGIAPEGTIIFLEDGALLCIATECTTATESRQVERLYWREEDPNDDN